MFAILIVIISAIMLMTFKLGGHLTFFYNVPSLVIVLVPALIAPFLVGSKHDVLKAWIALFNRESLVNCKNPKQYIEMFDAMGKTAMMMGWFGVVSGAVSVGSNVEPSEFPKVVGPIFAVLILTLLYGVMVKIFCHFACLHFSSVDHDSKTAQTLNKKDEQVSQQISLL